MHIQIESKIKVFNISIFFNLQSQKQQLKSIGEDFNIRVYSEMELLLFLPYKD